MRLIALAINNASAINNGIWAVVFVLVVAAALVWVGWLDRDEW